MRELLLASLLIATSSVTPPREGFARRAFEVSRDGTVIARIWPRAKAPLLNGAAEERAHYSRITRGETLGIVTFPVPWQDFRAQTVPAGTYELQYAVQPPLKDHAGTSRWRDFAILVGEASSRHPYVIALVPPEEATVVLDLGVVKVGLLLEGTGELGL